MKFNVLALIIFITPFTLITKGIYYIFLNNTKPNSSLRKYSIIKTDNELEFYQKNKFIAKAYFTIGSTITLFITIYNICYPVYTFKRAMLLFLIIFILDNLIEVLAKVKCQIHDYDNNTNEEEDIDD